MICQNCGVELTSDKIWDIHIKECQKEIEDIDYSLIDFQALKRLASEKGINTYKLKKEAIIQALLG